MLKLNDYKEEIDFEFSNFKKRILIKAIKTDANTNSLKQKLNLNCVKSCDYISFRGKSTLTLIECSDLNRQIENLNKDLNIDLDNLIEKCKQMEDKPLQEYVKKARKNHKKVSDKLIRTELIDTYKDTLHLVNKILALKEIDSLNRFKKHNFIVITNNLNTNIPEKSIAFDYWKKQLKHNLKSGLECLVTEVHIFTPEKFLSDFHKLNSAN